MGWGLPVTSSTAGGFVLINKPQESFCTLLGCRAGRAGGSQDTRRKRKLWETGRNLHFPQGTSCKQGPLFLAAGTRFSPQTDLSPASPFFLLSEKAVFRVCTSTSTPAPNLCKLFSLRPILLSHWVPERCELHCAALLTPTRQPFSDQFPSDTHLNHLQLHLSIWPKLENNILKLC